MKFIRALLVPSMLCCSATGAAQEATQPPPTVEPLVREAIEAAPGHSISARKLTVAPGYVTASHSHAGETFVYILEGRILNQIGDEEPKIYGPGQFFFEHANAHHAQFVNLDKDKPATVLIVGIGPDAGN
jgi:quercetin dioxygenase-like cupin family protein